MDIVEMEEYLYCHICGERYHLHDQNITPCPECHEPTCTNCSEGLSDMFYGYCTDCFYPSNQEDDTDV